MITAIVYVSHAGHTKQYARILGHKMKLPVFDLKTAKKKLQKVYSVFYLGWLMGGNISGYKKAKKIFRIEGLCGVGMAAGDSQIGDMKKTNTIPEGLPLFYLQGGFESEKLRGIYRLMMNVIKKTVGKKLAGKENRTPDEEEMLHLLTQGESKVSFRNLDGIIAWYSRVKAESRGEGSAR